jgi:hypothetical protein
MTPSELRAYLRERHEAEASLTDLALHFETNAEVVRDVLAYWQRKGKIRRLPSAPCPACPQKCAGTERYRWQETPEESGA